MYVYVWRSFNSNEPRVLGVTVVPAQAPISAFGKVICLTKFIKIIRLIRFIRFIKLLGLLDLLGLLGLLGSFVF